MIRLLVILLFILPVQSHAVLMRAVATGTVFGSSDETGKFGYGSDAGNPLIGATVLAQWTFDTEEAGPGGDVPAGGGFLPGNLWSPKTNWIDSVVIVRPVSTDEPVLKFNDDGGPLAPVSGADVFTDNVYLQNIDGEAGTGEPYQDEYRLVSSRREGPLGEPAVEYYYSAALISDIALISSETDLTQEVMWTPNDGGFGDGTVKYGYDGEFSGPESFVFYSIDSFTVRQVPEPGTLGMMGAGLFALGVMRRKRAA